jgi:hypothetical protein
MDIPEPTEKEKPDLSSLAQLMEVINGGDVGLKGMASAVLKSIRPEPESIPQPSRQTTTEDRISKPIQAPKPRTQLAPSDLLQTPTRRVETDQESQRLLDDLGSGSAASDELFRPIDITTGKPFTETIDELK